jgi:hypothetical protein
VTTERDSTLEGIVQPGSAGRWLARASLTALFLVVAAGASGLLGVHTSSKAASGGGYSITVDYPGTARAGLDALWQVRVVHPGGFEHDVTLTVSADYFAVFESQRFFPEPTDETRDGDTLYLTFARPPGDTLTVGYDAYIQPASQRGASATVSVLDEGRPAASVDFSTMLFP